MHQMCPLKEGTRAEKIQTLRIFDCTATLATPATAISTSRLQRLRHTMQSQTAFSSFVIRETNFPPSYPSLPRLRPAAKHDHPDNDPFRSTKLARDSTQLRVAAKMT